MRASELLRSKFGVSQLYKHQVKHGDEVILEIYWHPLTIAERESIQKTAEADDAAEIIGCRWQAHFSRRRKSCVEKLR